MGSPIITDEELEKENFLTKENINKMMKEAVSERTIDMNKEILEETEQDIKEDIPSNYIEINLVSNGRIEGIPKVLHFRCYSASDAIDLNVADDDKPRAISKVLSRLNYENFDISLLPVQDVLFILYKLHSAFISTKITKKVYIDDTIQDEELLDSDDNIEEVDIPISSISYAYLGKDYDDNELEQKIKVPFTIKDTATNESVQFRYMILKDMIMAEKYCHNYFKDDFIKYADLRSSLNKINNIKNDKKKDKMFDDYLNQNEEKMNEYYEFMVQMGTMVAKVVQCATIVSYNGKKLESLDEKWEVYSNKLSAPMWKKYNATLENFPFGISEEIDVYLPSLKKKVHRRLGFQFTDFIHVDKQENSDRCVVEFD